MKKKLYVFIALIGFAGIAFSQIVVVKGNVVSAEDNKPITGVHILIKSTQKGMTTDTNGHFDLQNVTLPVTLEISHISYEKKELRISKIDVEYDNVITLNISLILRTENLNDIAIYADKVHQLERLVYDFEVDDSSLYLICNKKDKKTLRVYDFNDYLKRSQTLPKGCSELGFDWQNRLFAKKGDNNGYWRISDKDTSLIYTKYDTVWEKTKTLVEGIIASPKYYFVANKSDNFWEHWCFYNNKFETLTSIPEVLKISRINIEGCFDNGVIFFSCRSAYFGQHKQLFRVYKDSLGRVKYNMMYYAFLDIDDWLTSSVKDPAKKVAIYNDIQVDNYTLNQLELYKKSGSILEEFIGRRDIFFLYRMQMTPIPVHFKIIGNYLYIFNFDKGVIYKLDQDNFLVSVVAIDEALLNQPLYYRLIFNQEGTRCFIKVEKTHQYVALQELDIATGKYIRTINLIKPKVEKIRIVGNYIYYTAAVEGKNAIERWLWKQDLY
ncbi:MAG: carboxypeptidase-like regulatory domain-containing protein [Bacteroidales bacterium]|jgi:hypothetical protein|nr:carboxypeptidase-like regulatory domain-containing protein [Bacteroidales bacterium]